MTIDEFSKHLIERSVSSLSEKYGEKCPKCGKSPCECEKEKEEVKEAKNKEGKEQGADGKACWKGYKYAGTENGKDKCVKAGYEMEGGEDLAERKDMPGNQEKIDANKNGKVDAHDFAILRARKNKKSVKEMWEKAAEVQEGYGKAKKSLSKEEWEEVVDEGKKVEIEIMPQVDTPNDPEPVTGKKAKKEVKKEEYDVETANQLWLEVGERLEKLGDMDDVNFKVLGEKKLSAAEKTKKEKFVKGMKKKFGSFKNKYGDKAKDVMYGTATAMAKKAAK